MTPHHALHNPNPHPRSNAQSHPRIHGRIYDRDSIEHSQLIDRTGPKSLDSAIKLQLTTNYYSLTKQLLSHLTSWNAWFGHYLVCSSDALLDLEAFLAQPLVPPLSSLTTIYRRGNGLATPYGRSLATL